MIHFLFGWNVSMLAEEHKQGRWKIVWVRPEYQGKYLETLTFSKGGILTVLVRKTEEDGQQEDQSEAHYKERRRTLRA